MRFAKFVDLVTSRRRATNDVYMISNNRNLEQGLSPLLDDVSVPARYLDHRRLAGCVSLWFGPAGTVTPLHHDTTNILFCQIAGRKRVRLIAPFEARVLASARSYYAALDAECATDMADLDVAEVELAPGDALFLPVGYWHHVRALDASISLSFTNFRWPTRFDWYVPGA
jgi:ribosomal protein L16 Arg81 hydroxylase